MRNVDNSPWQVDDELMRNALNLGIEEELKSDLISAEIPTQ